MTKAMSDELWASFLVTTDEEYRSDSEEDQSEVLKSNSNGARHLSSSAFLAGCDDTLIESPHELAASVTAKVKTNFRDCLPESLLDYQGRDCIAPFKTKEIVLGKLLGSGQFSHVYEVKSFCLTNTPASTEEEEHTRQYMKAREKYRNTKKSTYALKHLKMDLPDNYAPTQYAQFASDLALEGELLKNLKHPNIIKLRGISYLESFRQGPKGYFLVIDRLNETLAKRIAKWKKSTKRGSLDLIQSLTSRSQVSDGNALLSQKLVILLQTAAALVYLHEKKCIFRDLKPENIGFDVRGNVKLFDFGLTKMLPVDGNPYEDSYKMSIAGTPRYMAPEVLSGQRYNLKADVYTFSMLMWEVLSLKRPFPFVRSQEALMNHVLEEKGRPDINPCWPTSIKELLEESFGPVRQRPSMKFMFEAIRCELCHQRQGDDSKLKDSHLFRRRSDHSVNDDLVQVKRAKNDSIKISEVLSSLSASMTKISRKLSV